MKEGRSIQERYELNSEIGTGGMACVWRARDTRLNRDVAVKFLDPNLCEDPEFLVRFFSEAQSVAKINHPGVVAILDFGQEDGRPYLVMEYVDGGSVADLTGAALTQERSLEIIAQAAEGAGAAHANGIVHRDIKPANLLITETGDVKVADFGIAASKGGEKLTATGTAIGSPHYISPEQVAGGEANPASDVYSLGVVLYELLTGRRPFDGDNITAIAIAHVDKEPQPPSAYNSDIDPIVDSLVMRCLAKDPQDRFPNGAILAKAVQGTLAGRIDDGTGPIPVADDEPEAVREKPRTLAATMVIVLLLLAASAALLASTRSEDQAVATTTSEPSESPGKKRKKASPSPSASSLTSTSVATQTSPSPTPPPDKKKDTAEEEATEEEVQEEEEVTEEEPEPSPTPEPATSPESSPATTEQETTENAR